MAFNPGVTKSLSYAATSGGSVQIDNGITLAILTSSALLAALTVNFPKNPVDGQPLSVIAPKGVTLFTMVAAAGQSISGSPPAVATANSPIRDKFATVTNTWYPN